MNIVFNVNHLGLEGLGATLTSLIRNCSNPSELKLWFLCSDFRGKDKNNINRLLKSESFNGSIDYVDFDAKAIFGHLKSLHGDWTGYGRLLISNYIKSDTALYLDADLIVLLDVLELKNFSFKENILAAVYSSTVEWALESPFFVNSLGWSLDVGYFNSGVVLFNLKKWRELDVESKWKDLAAKYPNEFLAIDQTILNALCRGDFAFLPSNFNNPWYAGKEKPANANPDNSIIHFVGSPKPWDLFGKLTHKGYVKWNAYTTTTWHNQYGKLTISKVMRTWKIKKSIFKLMKKNK